MQTAQPLDNLLQHPVTLTAGRCFLMFRRSLPCFSLCPLAFSVTELSLYFWKWTPGFVVLRDWRKADQPVANWIFLLEDRMDVWFLLVLRNLFWSRRPFRDDQQWPQAASASSLSTHRCSPVHLWCKVQSVQMLLNPILLLHGQVFLPSDFASGLRDLGFLKARLTRKKQGEEGTECLRWVKAMWDI